MLKFNANVWLNFDHFFSKLEVGLWMRERRALPSLFRSKAGVDWLIHVIDVRSLCSHWSVFALLASGNIWLALAVRGHPLTPPTFSGAQDAQAHKDIASVQRFCAKTADISDINYFFKTNIHKGKHKQKLYLRILFICGLNVILMVMHRY